MITALLTWKEERFAIVIKGALPQGSAAVIYGILDVTVSCTRGREVGGREKGSQRGRAP